MKEVEDARAALRRLERFNTDESVSNVVTALRALITAVESLSAPPTEDERDAVLRAMRVGWANRQTWWTEAEDVSDPPSDDDFLADAIIASPVWRNRHREPWSTEAIEGAAIALDPIPWEIANPGWLALAARDYVRARARTVLEAAEFTRPGGDS